VVVGGERPDRLHFRPLIMITIAVLTFAATITTLGLLPAAAAVVLLGSMGGQEFRIFEAVLIAIFLTTAAYLIFKLGLNMTMPVLDLSILGLKP
jgi:putative tricarboxylic transport membrane protein